MNKWIKGITLLTVAVALSACGGEGKEYVGYWQAKEHAKHSAVIERNGDSFIIKITEPSIVERDKSDTVAMLAVYKDGILEVSNGFGTSKVSYVKDTDALLMPTMGGSMEYRRVK